METKKTLIFLMSLFLISFVYADGPPSLPDHFIGGVLINNENAEIGTEIEIYVEEELEDAITTTIEGEYSLYVKSGNFGDAIVFKIQGLEAGSYERQGGKTIGMDLEIENSLVGDEEQVKNNYDNLTIEIDGSGDLEGSFSGIKPIKIKDADKELMSFEFDFDNKVLDLNDIKIEKQSNDVGSVVVKGVPEGVIKTVYIDRLTESNNGVCIKDAEINSIDELSENCDAADEVKLDCPGTNEDYTCSVEDGDSRFKISGLSHSGIKEFYIAPLGDNSQNNNNNGGSSGGSSSGGSSKPRTTGCAEDWECQSWSVCKPDGTKSCFTWIDKNNCGTTTMKPIDFEDCVYENPESGDEEGEGLSGVTGAVVGTGSKATKWIVGLAAVVVLLGIVLNLGFIKRWIFGKEEF